MIFILETFSNKTVAKINENINIILKSAQEESLVKKLIDTDEQEDDDENGLLADKYIVLI